MSEIATQKQINKTWLLPHLLQSRAKTALLSKDAYLGKKNNKFENTGNEWLGNHFGINKLFSGQLSEVFSEALGSV